MRKVFFSFVATLAFGSFAMANNVEFLPVVEVEGFSVVELENIYFNIETADVSNDKNLHVNTDYIPNINEVEQTLESVDIRCWLFGKWLRDKLEDVSSNQALIDATVEAAVGICNAFLD